ncbi:MAG: 6-carboxytetrahydropterin synthase [Acidobacteria bacterium]|nr:6-carboxytetrahydropterin synthase [Acidobacteriota bacterium]MBV9147843.1 6-carboxytetrahydropterin synthase [Acidobacteriota bacterium]MBV9437520.1 6-carboxytetrahydropterin synthase [Acidobacteriota bacterium]
MKAHLTRRYQFSASHRLHSEHFDERQNREIYGKCNNPHGHGHNYKLEVTVSGEPNPETGMVCNLADLDSFVEREIMLNLQFSNLNEVEIFRNKVPTTENLSRELFHLLREQFRLAKVEKVRIEETMMNSFEYAGGRELGAL